MNGFHIPIISNLSQKQKLYLGLGLVGIGVGYYLYQRRSTPQLKLANNAQLPSNFNYNTPYNASSSKKAQQVVQQQQQAQQVVQQQQQAQHGIAYGAADQLTSDWSPNPDDRLSNPTGHFWGPF